MRSHCIAAAVAVALSGVLAATTTARAATSTTTVVHVDGGCAWAGGTWHFDGVTGAVWRSGGYAWCVSPAVAYASTTTSTNLYVGTTYYPYAAGSYAWAYTHPVVVAGPYGAAAYDPWTGNGRAMRGTARYDAATGTYAAGQQGAAFNRYNGDYAYGERGVAYNERTGAVAAGSHGTVGNAYTGNSVSGARGVAYDPDTGRAVRAGGVRGDNGGVGHVGNDWYVGRGGEVRQVGGGGGQRTRQRAQGGRRR